MDRKPIKPAEKKIKEKACTWPGHITSQRMRFMDYQRTTYGIGLRECSYLARDALANELACTLSPPARPTEPAQVRGRKPPCFFFCVLSLFLNNPIFFKVNFGKMFQKSYKICGLKNVLDFGKMFMY